jgi:hypothetical protein
MMQTHHKLTLVLAGCAALVLAGCDDSSSNQGTELADEPKSMYGKSAKTGKDLVENIQQRDAGMGGLADAASGAEMVSVAGLRWPIPEGWEIRPPANSMRAAEMLVSTGSGDCLVTFSQAGGSAQANINRWIGQVQDQTGAPKQASESVEGFTVSTVEVYGTFMDGSPMGPKTPRPNWILRGAVAEGPSGPVFIKMTGPEDAMDEAADGWTQLVFGLQPDR